MKFRLIACLLLPLLAPPLAAAHPAQEVVKQTADDVIERLEEQKAELEKNPDRLYSLVQELIIPRFDFEAMSRWVLGRNWRNASEEQREQFKDEFQTLLIRTYAKALLEYSDEEIHYAPVQPREDSDMVAVQTEVRQPGGNNVPINYRMRESDGEWKVIDVSVNGVSLVATYRGSFASEVRRGGMESLLAKMAERNAKSRDPEVPGVDK